MQNIQRSVLGHNTEKCLMIVDLSIVFVVLHSTFCHSAGVGRTGTFIALDWLLDQAKETQAVNVYQCVHDLREQRQSMIQSLVCHRLYML